MVLQSGRRWTQMVLAEHEQSERAMADLPPKDFWSGLSHRFVPPRPGEGGRDETLEALLASYDRSTPLWTWAQGQAASPCR